MPLDIGARITEERYNDILNAESTASEAFIRVKKW
jgi:hypothetical protein